MRMEMARAMDMGRAMAQVDMEIPVAWAWTGRYRRGRQDIGQRVLILSRRSRRGIELRRVCNDQTRATGHGGGARISDERKPTRTTTRRHELRTDESEAKVHRHER